MCNYSELISIIIPVYNVDLYLQRCLDSVLKNNYGNLEVICINDGSTDSSGLILEEYAKKDNRICVIHTENKGVSHARNCGLKIALGKWITFIDADDWIHPLFFNTVITSLQSNPTDVVVTDHIRTDRLIDESYIDLKHIEMENISGEQALTKLRSKNYVWGKLYSRECLENHFFDENIAYGEDHIFNISVLVGRGLKVLHIKEKLYYYYIRDGSAASGYTLEKRINWSNYAIEHAKEETVNAIKDLYIESAFKLVLSCRYESLFAEKKKRNLHIITCNRLLHRAMILMNSGLSFPIWKRFMYSFLYRFPTFYRFGRIIMDPTLIRWEHNFQNNN